MHSKKFSFAAVAVLAVLAVVAIVDPAFAAAQSQHTDGVTAFLSNVGILAASGAALRGFRSQKAALVASLDSLLKKSAAEGRDLTAEESAEFDKGKAAVAALNAQIERSEFLLDQSAGLAGGVELPGKTILGVSENIEQDDTRGFKSFGDFARAVKSAGVAAKGYGGSIDQRLGFNAAAPSTASNEGAGADGGFAIPPQFSQQIWKLTLDEDSLIPMTENTEISANSMIFPKDETTPWGGAGVQAYWQSEAAAITGSKMALTSETLQLHKLTAQVPVTNELLDDATAIGSYLQQVAPSRISWKANEAILFGDGVGKPLGALGSAATVVVSKESGQATSTLDPRNFSKMVSRLIAGELKNAIWLMQPDVLPILEYVTLGNFPIYLPNQSIAGSAYGMLKGRPVYISEHAAALNAQGDINLLSLKGYRTITKAGGIQTATSMHLYFDADATAFRFIFRINGKPILSAPITPPKSSNTRSHFVTLQAR